MGVQFKDINNNSLFPKTTFDDVVNSSTNNETLRSALQNVLHADNVYTKSQVDSALAGKSNTTHNHNGTYLPLHGTADNAVYAGQADHADTSDYATHLGSASKGSDYNHILEKEGATNYNLSQPGWYRIAESIRDYSYSNSCILILSQRYLNSTSCSIIFAISTRWSSIGDITQLGGSSFISKIRLVRKQSGSDYSKTFVEVYYPLSKHNEYHVTTVGGFNTYNQPIQVAETPDGESISSDTGDGLKTTRSANIQGSLTSVGNITAPTFIGTLSGNASTATKLQTPRTIWGQSFDGSGNIDGDFTYKRIRFYGDNEINTDTGRLNIGHRDTPNGIRFCAQNQPLLYGSASNPILHTGNLNQYAETIAGALDVYTKEEVDELISNINAGGIGGGGTSSGDTGDLQQITLPPSRILASSVGENPKISFNDVYQQLLTIPEQERCFGYEIKYIDLAGNPKKLIQTNTNFTDDVHWASGFKSYDTEDYRRESDMIFLMNRLGSIGTICYSSYSPGYNYYSDEYGDNLGNGWKEIINPDSGYDYTIYAQADLNVPSYYFYGVLVSFLRYDSNIEDFLPIRIVNVTYEDIKKGFYIKAPTGTQKIIITSEYSIKAGTQPQFIVYK